MPSAPSASFAPSGPSGSSELSGSSGSSGPSGAPAPSVPSPPELAARPLGAASVRRGPSRGGGPLLRGRGRALTAVAALAAAFSGVQLLAPAPASGASAPSGARLGDCAKGSLCLWEKAEFNGERHAFQLSDTDIESCVPLPKGASAAALANRTGRPVTVYQSEECAETGEFHTHPSGSWVPETEYQVRAFKIWEN